MELLGDGSYRPVAQVEISPDIKINDELPYVPAPEDVKPDVADGGQGPAGTMDIDEAAAPVDSSAMTASTKQEDGLEDVKPLVQPQALHSDNTEREVLTGSRFFHNFDPEITRKKR